MAGVLHRAIAGVQRITGIAVSREKTVLVLNNALTINETGQVKIKALPLALTSGLARLTVDDLGSARLCHCAGSGILTISPAG